MTRASELIESHFARERRPRDYALDGNYAYQMAVLRDLLARLDVILQDEGVPEETAARVMRCLLYGAPSAAEAELRMEHWKQAEKALREQGPRPIRFPTD